MFATPENRAKILMKKNYSSSEELGGPEPVNNNLKMRFVHAVENSGAEIPRPRVSPHLIAKTLKFAAISPIISAD